MANIKIKCKNCDSIIEINEDSDVVTCSVCHATNYINYTKNSPDDNEILFDFAVLKHPVRIFFYSVLSILLLTFTVIGITYLRFDNKNNEADNNTSAITNEVTTDGTTIPDEYEAEFFNNKYTIYEGTKGNGILTPIINSVILTNSNGKHIIVINYNGVIYKTEKELNELIALIDKSKDSVISFNYNSEGFINTIIINEVEEG